MEMPVFESNFDGFLNFLRDLETDSPTISPKRFGQVLRVDMQNLALKAHVHRNTIFRSPDSESVQQYLRNAVRVIRAAADVSNNIENAIFWYKNNPIPTFDYKTPQDLVSEGRTDTLVRYIQSLQSGYTG